MKDNAPTRRDMEIRLLQGVENWPREVLIGWVQTELQSTYDTLSDEALKREYELELSECLEERNDGGDDA